MHFYSNDSIRLSQKSANNHHAKNVRKNNSISPEIQSILWNQPHSTTDKHIPGKLSLCVGMPVMIRCNNATEICITKGQEGIVYGWQSAVGSHGQTILDTLFVRLLNPPSPVKFDGLPENVVPIPPSTTAVVCSLPDDTQINISRTQVEVLPNFAMTDYAPQGKTRPFNVVDLHNSRSHQSYYTALSRSASASGTIILQGFNPSMITGNASGALRQEFCDLELLDEITKLRYNGKLHESVEGIHRNILIDRFRSWKGQQYVPENVHKAIRWSKKDPMLEPNIEFHPWQIVQRQGKPGSKSESTSTSNAYVIAQGSTPITNKLKRKAGISEIVNEESKLKKMRLAKTQVANSSHTLHIHHPRGFTWANNSCAFDAVLSIIHEIWACNLIHWKNIFEEMNPELLGILARDFERNINGEVDLEYSREALRQKLARSGNINYRIGSYIGVDTVLEKLLQMQYHIQFSQVRCPQNHPCGEYHHRPVQHCFLQAVSHSMYTSTAAWIQNPMETQARVCTECNSHLENVFSFIQPPNILALSFPQSNLHIDTEFLMKVEHNDYQYILRGIIYCTITTRSSRHASPRGLNEGK